MTTPVIAVLPCLSDGLAAGGAQKSELVISQWPSRPISSSISTTKLLIISLDNSDLSGDKQ
jgi:hypothetical protein